MRTRTNKELLSYLLVHVLQAGEDHHTVGQAALHQEMEGVPTETERDTVNDGGFQFGVFIDARGT